MKRPLMFLLLSATVLSTIAYSAEIPNVVDACRADSARLCSALSPGSNEAMRCLRGRPEDVTAQCRAALSAHRDWLLARIRSACAGEIAVYCTQGQGVSRTLFRCLRAHETQLSAVCRATLPPSII